MFKVYLFAQMLKIAKNIDTKKFSKDENDAISFIKIQPYIAMIRDYLSKQWSEPYSITHMLREAVNGNIAVNKGADFLSINFEDIVISRLPQRELIPSTGDQTFKDKYDKAVLYDDKLYDSGYDWWVHYKNVINYEVLLKSGNTGLHKTIYYGTPDDPNSKFEGIEDWVYSSAVFQWWLFSQWGQGLTETYRITLGTHTEVEPGIGKSQFKKFMNITGHSIGDYGYPEVLAGKYVRYVCTKQHFDQYTPSVLRQIVYGP